MITWQKIILDVDPSHVELWSDHLFECGALSIDVGDALADGPEEVPLFGEPGYDEEMRFWQSNHLSALFEHDANQNWLSWISEQANILNLPLPHCALATLDDQDWVTLTQNQFQPIQISQRLWIVPSWHTPQNLDAINLIVDPGMAFGTGTHPTTRLCLQWLDRHLNSGTSVLDYGCGSGILAMAAAKLAQATVTGVDIDPVALTVAKQNAEQNHVQLHTLLPNELNPDTKFDVVIANILANPLRVLAPILSNHLNPGGILVLSGLWREQADEIAALYTQFGCTLSPAHIEEGWALLVGMKIPSIIMENEQLSTLSTGLPLSSS
jgi:ribosomal protein L11 methyltransferase